MDRRTFLGASASLLAVPRAMAAPFVQPPVARVILDNDFAGDPDGLFQLAHHLLCRSVRIPLIIGSHLPARFGSGHDAVDSAQRAADIVRLLGLAGSYRPLAGAETPLGSAGSAVRSAATAPIVREALREDTRVPLIYAAGAGLTELALAWRADRRIGRRLRLIWIGGNTHSDVAPPGAMDREPEFNFSIDPVAAQLIFNESDIEIWQVPSATYRTMLFGTGELDELGGTGPLGAYLKAAVDSVPAMLARIPGFPPLPQTDAYVLGDSPLVTLSALVTPFAADPASSDYRLMPTPRLNPDGSYTARAEGRPMRVYTRIDTGLTFRDMMARFRLEALRAGR
ncbi:nucleoside hydrolase [Sphingomonas ginkgonis]|uniref:Nucleoside hydrolase n=1 Tax=Sphingomonas ginkgonis TaxID=2315330 RepID=A0A3R9Z8D8_9SPHN|nr:nucleoside hydrolase [Sphingomonas ginkgonis]